MADFVAATPSPDERIAFEKHLEGCSECAAFFHTYKRTIDALREFRIESSPLPFLQLRRPPEIRLSS
jgi:anti-sigma factor RsiW